MVIIPGDRSNNRMCTQEASSSIERFSICIGGISCAIVSQQGKFLDLLRTRYCWFESTVPVDYEIMVQVVPIKELEAERNTRRTLQINRMNSGDDYIIKRTDNPFEALVNISSKRVLVKMWQNVYCFDSFLRMFFSLVVTSGGGLMLHASAVSNRKQGSVFFGPSGAGKTTIARLSEGRTILTDELTIIRPHDGGYHVYGTPFWGEFTPGPSNARAALSGLYSLKKAKVNGLVPIDRAQAVMELYRCVLFFGNEAHLLSRILDTCCSLVDAVPVYELHFLPHSSFWHVLDERSQYERMYDAE
ncbi:MAG: hypothetical protein JSV32_01305 [Dehalococcoidia bacterium]|nr:MAG: hypothetical protein JSV32_01305 [Dehalococcoidia bacterium]